MYHVDVGFVFFLLSQFEGGILDKMSASAGDAESSPQQSFGNKKRERSAAAADSKGSRTDPQHYFVVDDIVWVRPPGFPFWPAEVRQIDCAKNSATCALFCPPKSLITSADDVESPASSSTKNPPVPGEVLVTSQTKRLYFFDKLRTEEELVAVVEERLCRKKHNVSLYEFEFVAAVRRANSLVRIVLSPASLTPFSVCGVGVVHSLMRTHVAAPRQPSTKEFTPQTAVIVLKPGLENAVRDLKGFERIWVLFHFSYAVGMKQTERDGAEHASGYKTMIVPPRDTVARGVFATRSPHRPNGIGLSCVRLLRVQGLEVHISDHDLLHGTPVLDIKPYLPFCDAHPTAKAGWVQELDERGEGLGDHRGVADASIAVHRNFEHCHPLFSSHAEQEDTLTAPHKATRHA